jgi:hypothetical protein
MTKNTNMGRGSHHAQDAELNQTEPAANAAKVKQSADRNNS